MSVRICSKSCLCVLSKFIFRCFKIKQKPQLFLFGIIGYYYHFLFYLNVKFTKIFIKFLNTPKKGISTNANIFLCTKLHSQSFSSAKKQTSANPHFSGNWLMKICSYCLWRGKFFRRILPQYYPNPKLIFSVFY